MKQISCFNLPHLLDSRKFWLSFMCCALMAVQGGAQTSNTWDRGAGTNNWNDAFNWSLNIVPTPDHDVIIPDNSTVRVNTNAVCNSLVLDSGGQSTSVTIYLENSLTVSNQVIINGPTISNKLSGISVGDGLFSCGSLTMGNPTSNSSYCYLTIGNGTAIVNGDLTMTGNDVFENQVSFGGVGRLNIAGNMSSTGKLNPGRGTVNYMGMDQTVGSYTYYKLDLSGSGTKTLTDFVDVKEIFTIHEGVSLTTNSQKIIFGGHFFSSQAIDFGASPVTIGGTVNQMIDGFTTKGIVYVKNDEEIVTFTGNVQGGSLTMNTRSGTLNLGTNLTHTFTDSWQQNSGTLDAGSSTLRLGNGFGNITINTFASNKGTIEYFGPALVIAPLTYYNLVLSGPGVKTIAPQSQVTVNGTLDTNGLLVINSDATHSGSLIVKGASIGNVTYNRWLDPANTNPSIETPGFCRWYIVSAPVKVTSGFNNATNAEKIHVDPTPHLYDFANYSESANDWNYEYSATAATNLPGGLTPGQSYLISLKPESDGILQFTGALNNDEVPFTLTCEGEMNGWNAIGNPYTSAVKVAGPVGSGSFLDLNSHRLDPHYAALYVWNETAFYDQTQQYYRVIGNAGYTSPLAGISRLKGVENIQTGQGFLVKAGEGGNIVFNKAMQVSQNALGLKSSEQGWAGFTLLAQSRGQLRSTVVAFNDQMTTGLDVTYDAGLLASDVFRVYTHLVEGANLVDFAIQCLPDHRYRELSIPVGVDLPHADQLTFKVAGLIIPHDLYPVIEDKLLGIRTALKDETDSYTVSLDKSIRGVGRFYLTFEGIGVGTTKIAAEMKFTASFMNSRIVVWGTVIPGTKALLYDISGRKVGEYPLLHSHRNEIRVSNLNQRIYILKIEGRNRSQTLKLVTGL